MAARAGRAAPRGLGDREGPGASRLEAIGAGQHATQGYAGLRRATQCSATVPLASSIIRQRGLWYLHLRPRTLSR